MATTFSILGQSSPTVPVSTPLPVLVPAQASATSGVVISSVVVTNRSVSSTDYIYIKVASGGVSGTASSYDKQYIAYKVSIAPQATIPFVFGITIGNTDTVIAYSENGNCSFNAFGSLNS